MAALSVKNLHPTPGYVLVEPAKQDKQTASGIYLPDSHDEKPQHGTVLASAAIRFNSSIDQWSTNA